jgi:hypothetical protein
VGVTAVADEIVVRQELAATSTPTPQATQLMPWITPRRLLVMLCLTNP